MGERIVDLAEESAELHVRNSQCIIERDGREQASIPLCDLSVLVVSHPRVMLSQSVLSGIAGEGGVVVVCDERRAPVSMMLPLNGNYVQSERFIAQAHASAPTCKRLWQQIIKAKIRAQGRVLRRVSGADAGLEMMSRRVRSGDVSNLEAQASRRYWTALFRDDRFRRDREAEDQNRYLNYGYAVLRAVTARAICAAGLHPSLGVHHHNRYNGFCLADDLMEPFRPLVDDAAYELYTQSGPDAPLNKFAKSCLIGAVMGRHIMEGESRTLFDILSRTAVSLAAVFMGERRDLALPEMV